jgi:hypothetical protein
LTRTGRTWAGHGRTHGRTRTDTWTDIPLYLSIYLYILILPSRFQRDGPDRFCPRLFKGAGPRPTPDGGCGFFIYDLDVMCMVAKEWRLDLEMETGRERPPAGGGPGPFRAGVHRRAISGAEHAPSCCMVARGLRNLLSRLAALAWLHAMPPFQHGQQNVDA